MPTAHLERPCAISNDSGSPPEQAGLVSVITPTYNRAHYLREAIESVQAQMYARWELIIMDDGSTDGTQQVVEAYRRCDPRIRYMFQQNAGPSRARAAALRAARGEFIAFLDDDDLWRPDKLKKQVERMRQDPSLGFLYSQCAVIQDGSRVASWPGRVHPHTFQELFRTNFVPCLTVMVRKRCLDEIGGIGTDLPVSQDYDLWLRLAERFRFDWLPEELATYRMHKHNMSRDRFAYYRDRFTIVARTPISRRLGISRAMKTAQRATLHLGLAHLYQQQGAYARALAHHWRGLIRRPLIGLRTWEPAFEGRRFTAPARLLKPYVALLTCLASRLRTGWTAQPSPHGAVATDVTDEAGT